MTQRFKKAYDALCNAFFEGTLAKGTCAACAVGNIVADALNAKVFKDDLKGFLCDKRNDFWNELFFTQSDGLQHKFWEQVGYCDQTKTYENMLLILTDYSVDEMAQIEYAFETNTHIHHKEYDICNEQEILEDQYKGLCAVFEVMCKLDNIEVNYRERLQEKENLVLTH